MSCEAYVALPWLYYYLWKKKENLKKNMKGKLLDKKEEKKNRIKSKHVKKPFYMYRCILDKKKNKPKNKMKLCWVL